ncbi:unnamed protein product [Rhizoctonia solani]|uniref:HNH nuclease domain-containing protein n=1 Tax=Rhizoctonia solani TaxID=456999 RepID=A0A8H3EFH0_9AGAM|nr:unnamed protein product [Rhizoctonia solani]
MGEPGALVERIAGDEHTTTDDSEREGLYVSGAPASTSGYSRPSSITRVPSHCDWENVTKMAPVGCRCVITNRQSNLECAHILSRATKLDDRKTLAFCWGIKLTDLDLDATDIMMWLTPDMHTSFDESQWALVPPLEILSDVLINLVRHERKAFTKLYPPKRDWEYTFAQLVPCPDTIVREDHHPPTIHYSPYTTLPTVTPHIHPYYDICNVAKKDAKYNEIPHEATSRCYETLSNQENLAPWHLTSTVPTCLPAVNDCACTYGND